MLVVRAEKRIRQNIMEVLDAILQKKVIINFLGMLQKKDSSGIKQTI